VGSVAPAARVSDCLCELITADVIVVLTNDPSAQLTPGVVRAGCIVIDVAEPPNISSDAERNWPGGVKIFRGGRVRIPNYQCTYDCGLPDPAETYACLAETYLFARDGIREHSVGTPRVELAERLARTAPRHGIQPSLFDANAGRMMAIPATVS
jgi:predicted amino acid dehydrogenase